MPTFGDLLSIFLNFLLLSFLPSLPPIKALFYISARYTLLRGGRGAIRSYARKSSVGVTASLRHWRRSSWSIFDESARECVVVGMRLARVPECGMHSDEPVAALTFRISWTSISRNVNPSLYLRFTSSSCRHLARTIKRRPRRRANTRGILPRALTLTLMYR